jgi:hypothetical protein
MWAGPPFGKFTLFGLIVASLFGAFGLLRFLNPFFSVYHAVALYALMASAVCLVLWLAKTLFFPKTLLTSLIPQEGAISRVGWLNAIFCQFPHFRVSVIALLASLVLFWVHSMALPIGITAYLITTVMFVARLIFR